MTRAILLPGFWLILMLLCCSLAPLRAEQFGLFTYRVVAGNTVEITRYPSSAGGLVDIPATIGDRPVTSIGSSAFFNCWLLTGIVIPSSVETIGSSAFYGCSGLVTVGIPSSVTVISDLMFANCGGLTSLSLPPNISSIGTNAFMSCYRLTSMILPVGITKIGNQAFFACHRLTSVSLPSSLTSIGSSAFSYCRDLAEITVPSGVTQIGQLAFHNCISLKSIVVEPGSAHFTSIGGILFNVEQSALIAYPQGKSGPYTLPSAVNSVAKGAFADCIGLEAILVDPENTHFTSVNGVLLNAGKTTLIAYPAGMAGAYTMPPNVTTIQSYACSGCTGLSGITLPPSLSDIGDAAFYNCTGLSVLTLPSNIALIGAHAFSGCIRLTSLTFSSSLIPASIGSYSFSGCRGLLSLTLPSNFRSIGSYAFSNCSKLSTATFLGNVPTLGGSVFTATPPEFTIYYLSSGNGFTSPTWNGYPATMIDETTWPAASWLMIYGLPHNADLHQDPDNDGVNLLMAYALNLDPRLNLQHSLPTPTLGGNALSLSFHATSPGITYRVETSTDLQIWTTQGVTLSAPDVDHQSTASVPRDTPSRYLRLVVEN